jgi:hypothetical protein
LEAGFGWQDWLAEGAEVNNSPAVGPPFESSDIYSSVGARKQKMMPPTRPNLHRFENCFSPSPFNH